MHASAQLEGGPRSADKACGRIGTSGMRGRGELVRVVAMLSPQPDRRPSADACLAAAEGRRHAGYCYEVHSCSCSLPAAACFVTEEERPLVA